jgi:hypothetical protein
VENSKRVGKLGCLRIYAALQEKNFAAIKK